MQSYIFKNGIPTRDVMSGKRYICPLDYRADSSFLSRSQLTTNIHWLCYCTVHLYVVFHFYNGMWSFWVEVICAGLFLSFIYIIYQEDKIGITLTCLTPPYVCAYSLPGSGFPTSFVGDCSFCWYWWNWWPALFKLSFHNAMSS